MKIAVLALQGAFLEHRKMFEKLGVEVIELRQKKDLLQDYDGLVLPGGESSVQGQLLKDLGMFKLLKTQIEHGLPTLATCAGVVLLSQDIENDDRRYFQTLPITVKRNASGRQSGSYKTKGHFECIGDIPMTFIRAPYITRVNKDVRILSTINGHIVGVCYHNQLALSFHPELDDDDQIARLFITLIERNKCE